MTITPVYDALGAEMEQEAAVEAEMEEEEEEEEVAHPRSALKRKSLANRTLDDIDDEEGEEENRENMENNFGAFESANVSDKDRGSVSMQVEMAEAVAPTPIGKTGSINTPAPSSVGSNASSAPSIGSALAMAMAMNQEIAGSKGYVPFLKRRSGL